MSLFNKWSFVGKNYIYPNELPATPSHPGGSADDLSWVSAGDVTGQSFDLDELIDTVVKQLLKDKRPEEVSTILPTASISLTTVPIKAGNPVYASVYFPPTDGEEGTFTLYYKWERDSLAIIGVIGLGALAGLGVRKILKKK